MISFRTHVVWHCGCSTFDSFGAANQNGFHSNASHLAISTFSQRKLSASASSHTHAHNQNNGRNKAVLIYCTGCSNWRAQPMSPGAKQIQSKFILKVNNLWRHKTFTFNLQMGCLILYLLRITVISFPVSLSLCVLMFPDARAMR